MHICAIVDEQIDRANQGSELELELQEIDLLAELEHELEKSLS